MSQRTRMSDPRKGDAILKAAVALFLKHGYEKTTMDEVARLAGVTKQTVYSHGRSKETLFLRIVENLCKQGVTYRTVKGQEQRPFEELLFEIGLNLLTRITSPEGMSVIRLVVAESGRYPKIAKLYYENGSQRIVQLLAEFMDAQNARGAIAIPNTQSAASYFLALLKGQYFLRMLLGVPPIPSSREKKAHVQEVVAIFMTLYGSKAPLVTHSTL